MKTNLARSTDDSNSLLRAPVNCRFALGLATEKDREVIYRIRHEVYARELRQHTLNAAGRLSDPLDDSNIYLVATIGHEVAGFISATAPACPVWSIDKYFKREQLPLVFDDKLYEIRLLTVLRPHRGRELAMLLMYAAFRWVESHGGQRIVAIGRREVLELYQRVGLQTLGLSIQSGAVTYDLLHATTERLRDHLQAFRGLLARIEEKTDWQLNVPFRKPAACFHGGAFFAAIGERFDHLERIQGIINADVLDAWFPPAPGVVAALQEQLPWLLRTSPPTGCDGMIQSIALAR